MKWEEKDSNLWEKLLKQLSDWVKQAICFLPQSTSEKLLSNGENYNYAHS